MQETEEYSFSANRMLKGILRDGVRVFKGITYARYQPFSEAVP